MKTVIAGTGGMGFHLAQLLAREQHDIVLLDLDKDVLDYVGTHIDVMTIKGDSSSLITLEKAEVGKCDLFIAVTASEKNNLITTILAKQLGAKKTIARVYNEEFLSIDQRKEFRTMGIDILISPTKLAANEITRLIKECQLTDLFDFEEGKMSLLGYTIDDSASLIGEKLVDIVKTPKYSAFRPIAILRRGKTIIPNGNTKIKREDHLYFLSDKKSKEGVMCMVNQEVKEIKRIMIIGSTNLAFQTARELEKNYHVQLVSNNKIFCTTAAEELSNTLVLRGDPNNIELLKEEGLEDMDAFIALTHNSETNIITSLMAEDTGVYKTISLVENTAYTRISQNIGVDTIVNTKIIGANNIFRFIRKGKIEAITTLHGVDAEIIEFIVPINSPLVNDKIMDLDFPKDAIIGGVIRGQQTFLPNGSFKIKPNDKVIILTKLNSIKEVEKLFD